MTYNEYLIIKLQDKEFYSVMEMFEKDIKNIYLHGGTRLDKENKNLWEKQIIYQNGLVNGCFKLYLRGYSYAKALYGESNE